MYYNNPDLKKNKALHPIQKQEENIIIQAIKQSRNFSNTQSDINASHYWNHMCNQLVCSSCNIKASKWKPGMYNDALYNSSLPLQWYFKPSTPNHVHLCPECMHDSNWDFVGPSANGRCQPHPKHFNLNRNHDWNLYKDQEVPKTYPTTSLKPCRVKQN